jgi:CubicO group peptidase (beta-lactamase class C family)
MGNAETILKKMVQKNKSPSVQYILFDQDAIIEKYNLGLADIDGHKNVSDATTYNAFSVTKTFTALAVLQLAENKIIDIEERIQKYLPDFPYSASITTRHLLSHMAGIPNPIPLSWIHLATEHQFFDRNKFFKGILIKHNQLKAEPNQKFAYSNLGYVLLGQLIEKVTQTSYEQYIADNIIKRLGLTADDLGFVIPDAHLHSKGYIKNLSFTNFILGFFIQKSKFMGHTEGKWKSFLPFYVNGTSYGGLVGTPAAFVRYIQQLLRPDNHLLSESYKKKLFTENSTATGKPTGMCFAWFAGKVDGNRYYAHAGGGGGYYCEIRLYPDKGLGSVIFFNRTGVSDERILDKVDAFYFR